MDQHPGSTVGGRYRVDRLLVDVPEVRLWHGHDEVLDRPVTVRVVSAGHPRVDAILEAARSTACLQDRRLARVLDADRVDPAGDAYVVTAWAPGRDLAAVLREAPLDHADATALVADVADAVAGAHEQGFAHLALDPTNVVVDGHEATVLGLAVDALLWQEADPATDPARVDAAGLGALLYACVTARWPLGDPGGRSDEEVHGLATAPRVGGRVCTPRQVSAAVPASVDALCRRSLALEDVDDPLLTPRAVSDALRALAEEGERPRWRPAWLRRERGSADR